MVRNPLRFFLILCFFSILSGASYNPLTTYQKFRAITNYGDLAMYAKIVMKLSRRQCLNITAVGGSVSNGHFNHTMLPKAVLWHQRVGQMLNEAFPCGPNGHQVTAFAKGSIVTRYWMDYFAGRQEELLFGSDLVMIETAANQLLERDVASREEETFLSMVLLQSRRLDMATNNNRQLDDLSEAQLGTQRKFSGTAAMFVIPSSRCYSGFWSGVPFERTGDAMYAQLPVAQHHGAAIVSVLDALGPFPTRVSQEYFNATWFPGWPWGDKIHPDANGHRVVAELIVNYIQTIYQHANQFRDHPLPMEYVPRDPMFIDVRSRDMYLDLQPISLTSYHFNLRKVNNSPMDNDNCKAWRFYADVPNKPGFISTTTNSYCQLYLPPKDVQRLTLGEAHVELLKSYMHMGTVAVTIFRGVAGRDGTSCARGDLPDSVLGSHTVDCLWSEPVSLAKIEVFKFQLPQPRDDRTCLILDFTIRATNRESNKIKVLGFSLF
ncbi:hypothetical protein VOLCADRAFT_105097 [Volvox carteri f. nagariensis]|uniref:SGNH hydrolase-type esterase domain-containing protein n=2 Tax=Volvox carteri f. nagariensis TaxID=3068 RepID=D8TYE4_VOLCA|nr:uncharacterized protein VOLCADRAFT_105097 [Volvox carteri f. nagariensis]EFJ47540.1 hypothetical protein VOLCADRAFT_105097 [Volvox carteri f. nagariensis]|eukprot:XP_002951364.1 hypothetical protein VOLCADRAFT_105097 [Volvox carteri f. nagariensis]